MKLCECGCNNFVTKEANRFIQGHNNRGRERPKHEKIKISKTMKEIMTEEMKEIRRKTWTGRKHSDESKNKMSVAAKIREKNKKENGWKRSDKSKKQISDKLKGRIFEKEHKEKISKNRKGIPVTQITKEKISNTLKGKFVGDKNPAWKGGRSNEPYNWDWNENLRKEIKNRDNWTCKICNKNNNLVVHHIDENKKNSKKENLITLCRQCHAKIHNTIKNKTCLIQKNS